jgi:Zn-dependent protease
MAYAGGEGRSLTLGTLWGMPWSVHWTFLLILIIQIVVAIFQFSVMKYTWMIVVLWGPVLLLTVLLHEFGHIFRTRAYPGGYCTSIILFPLGGFSTCHIPDGSVMQEFWVALCGPLTHIPQILFWLLIMGVSAPDGVSYFGQEFDINEFEEGGADQWFAALGQRAMVLNIILFAINLLLPAYPLDGARMLAALGVRFGLSIPITAIVIAVLGMVIGLVCFIYGIVKLISGDGPGVLLLLIGLYVAYTSGSLFYMNRMGLAHQHPLFGPECYRNANGGNDKNGTTALSNGGQQMNSYPPSRSRNRNPKNGSEGPSIERGDKANNSPRKTAPLTANAKKKKAPSENARPTHQQQASATTPSNNAGTKKKSNQNPNASAKNGMNTPAQNKTPVKNNHAGKKKKASNPGASAANVAPPKEEEEPNNATASTKKPKVVKQKTIPKVVDRSSFA